MGRVLMIYADAGGRPISHPVVCHERARRRLVRDARLDSRCSTIARLHNPIAPMSSLNSLCIWLRFDESAAVHF